MINVSSGSRRRWMGWGAAGKALLLACGATIASVALVAPVRAQMLLYENRLPDGFAYVRFANTLPEAITIKPAGFADTVTLGNEGASRVSPYYTVEKVAGRALSIDLTTGGTSGHAVFELKPAIFHTVLIGRDDKGTDAKVVADQSEINQTRARLAFYNAVPDCTEAGLQLDPGGSAVFSGIAPGSMRGRSVNPAAKARVKAACGASRSTSLDLGRLDAGGQYSIWLMAPSGPTVAFMSENTIAPYLR